MKLVFIYGHPGSGKLTVAKELAKLTGMRLFHNHLTVDLVASMFEFGTKPFRELRERIWLDSFRTASKEKVPGLIFTFVFENTVSKGFVEDIRNILSDEDQILFIELSCKLDELKRRVELPSRKKYGKLSCSKRLGELIKGKSCFSPKLAQPVFRIDNTHMSAKTVAKEIREHFNLRVDPKIF